jgi:hypothetical protein
VSRSTRIFRQSLILLITSVFLLSTVVIPATAHEAPNSCGDQRKAGAGWFDVFGHNVGCKRARKVARKWENKCAKDSRCRGRERDHIDVWPGYSCRHKQSGYETVRVRCRAEGDRIVHFQWGS